MDEGPVKTIISCSRRSDVPRWHADWLAAALRCGTATYHGPGGRARTAALCPEDVHSLVFWSKDYRHFLLDTAELTIPSLLAPYNTYFHFTITGLGGTPIEPGVPPPHEALGQMTEMARRWGPERINWRFDPVVVWEEDGQSRSNLETFPRLAEAAAAAGVTRCTFSFADWSYRKCGRRAEQRAIPYVDPPEAEKQHMAGLLVEMAAAAGLELFSCAGPAWTGLPGVGPAACVDAALLQSLHSQHLPATAGKDSGQRRACGCSPSVDIGTYARCPHDCVYCYANPAL